MESSEVEKFGSEFSSAASLNALSSRGTQQEVTLSFTEQRFVESLFVDSLFCGPRGIVRYSVLLVLGVTLYKRVLFSNYDWYRHEPR